MLLTLRYDEPLSNFAFNFNLRRYTKAAVLGMGPSVQTPLAAAAMQGAVQAAVKVAVEVMLGRHCPPRHPTHFKDSSLVESHSATL